MTGIIDYGAGNIRSVANALTHVGVDYRVCAAPGALDGITRVLLPGVGHFGSAATRLWETGLFDALRARITDGVPVLGICLGMQLLFETSSEAPDARGLGVFGGDTVALAGERVPHMGWNSVAPAKAVWPGGHRAGPFYFAHSFVVEPAEPQVIAGRARVGDHDITAVVGRQRVWGVQFHPEKSGPTGLRLLEEFAAW